MTRAVPDKHRPTKRRYRRLWPLLFLPVLGFLAGLGARFGNVRPPFSLGAFDAVELSMLGLLIGCGAMMLSASVVLVYRIARQRFTIGALLITIAVVAGLLRLVQWLWSS